MLSLNSKKIENILKKLHFSDKTSLLSRSSRVIEKKDSTGFSVEITNLSQDEAQKTINQAKLEIQKLGILNVNIALTSKKSNDKSSKAKIKIDGTAQVIAIVSGKGGVGKSTLTSLLAYFLKSQGKKVAIIDADIYGPSIPNIFNLSGKPSLENNKMIPLKNYGIEINSIGFLADPKASISWRGPMVSKALYQLLSLTKWEDLDYLLIDTPPGTGDIHISLLENYQVDKLVLITTPQDIAMIDARRSLSLYKKFNIDADVIFENMSFLQNKDGTKSTLFSGNAGDNLCKEYKVNQLIKLPFLPQLSNFCDSGKSLESFSYLLKNLKMGIK